MAPEQVRGDEVDARTDIYGLGLRRVFPAYRGGRLQQIGRDGDGDGAPLGPTRTCHRAGRSFRFRRPLERIVMACLAKRPNDRPQSAVELRAMLDACTDVPQWSQADADRWWALHRPDAPNKALP